MGNAAPTYSRSPRANCQRSGSASNRRAYSLRAGSVSFCRSQVVLRRSPRQAQVGVKLGELAVQHQARAGHWAKKMLATQTLPRRSRADERLAAPLGEREFGERRAGVLRLRRRVVLHQAAGSCSKRRTSHLVEAAKRSDCHGERQPVGKHRAAPGRHCGES